MTACLGYLCFDSGLPPEVNVFPLDGSGYPIPSLVRTIEEVDTTTLSPEG